MKRILQKVSIFVVLALFSFATFAQTGVKGVVQSARDGNEIIGATITVAGTTNATISDLNGAFELKTSAGEVKLVISYIGYENQELTASVANGKMTDLGVIKLIEGEVELSEIMVAADRAKERETPVAFSDVKKKEIQAQLGSRDIPLIMNSTPSVYATAGGGGAGDARINVRGFNQSNVAIMLNGVPINDMENGWVYWSNWDGISDATSSIQMQRGLSAVNLATPSVGGTMNIITSPAEQKAGGVIRGEYGSGNFMKTSITGHSGLIKDKMAVSVSVVRKVGNGVIDKTWTDAWAYYLGASYKINKKHKIELFAMGAPQRHGQNLYKQNIATYGHDIAKKLGGSTGYDENAFDAFPEANRDSIYGDSHADARGGRYYNENWGYISDSTKYTGKQYWNGKEHDRHANNFINERENFYHKPLVNLNLYSHWTDRIHQYTTLYYSGGTGGGSGTYGDMKWNYSGPSRFIDWDNTIANNIDNDATLRYKEYNADGTVTKVYQSKKPGQSLGILRNSVNQQWTVGAISKFKIIVTENLKVQAGIDWRTAQIGHWREIRDLAGGSFFSTRDADGNKYISKIEDGKTYYAYNESDFWSGDDYDRKLGDKVEYHFTNQVDWAGYFGQAEYSNKAITVFGMFGNSFIKYAYTNHFKKAEGTDNELTAVTKYLPGYQIKGGISWRAFDGFSVFANGGYISKAPIFDNIIDDKTGTMAENPQNEIFQAIEGGVTYTTPSRNIDLKANYYHTAWNNRAKNISVYNQDGTEGYVYIKGMNQLHQGVEFEATYRPIKMLKIGAIASIADWEYTSDVTGKYKSYNAGAEEEEEYTYYVNGLKVGDAPQTQVGGMFILTPVKGLRFQVTYKYNSEHYADWDPFSRKSADDKTQVWKTPAYQLINAHLSYLIPIGKKYSLEVSGHVFNALDEIYIQDAVDNSKYNSYRLKDDNGDKYIVNPHSADAAEVYLGLPRTFNVGLKFMF